MKHFTSLIVAVAIAFTLTSTSFAGNDANDKNNTNGNAYGHDKGQCNCECSVDFDILVAASKQALIEHEEEKAAEVSMTKSLMSTTSIEEPDSVDVETRRFIVHKVSDDASNNAGYYGFDSIGYTKDQKFADFVNNSTDGMTEAYITIVNSFGEKITIKLNAYLSSENRDGWDTFLAGRD